MADESNVVEVEFQRRKPLSAAEVREELARIDEELLSLQRDRQKRLEWSIQSNRWLRKCNRELEAEVGRLRAALYPFGAEQVLQALRDVYEGEPVAATAVASVLIPEPSQSARTRTGQLLSQLASEGLVRKFPPPLHPECGWPLGRRTCRWEPLVN